MQQNGNKKTFGGYKERSIELPAEVDVYRNLRRKAMSVKARTGKYAGRVIAHEKEIILRDVKFVVREKGWKKFHRTGKKNVHAEVRGTLFPGEVQESGKPKEITYNPKKNRHFVISETGKPVKSANLVRIRAPSKIEGWCVEKKKDPVSFKEEISNI